MVPAMSDHDELQAAARSWIDGDPDPVTRAELEGILASGDDDALAERMGATLRFGTAGIRGAVEAGSNRMNRAMVIRTTKGLADHLLDRSTPGPVVVGFDGRLDSRRFAEDTIGVLVAHGIGVRYFADVAPTPLVSYAARRLGAAAAVVVTASHNPPRDNGYKVYDANSAQIVPPTDGLIAAAIDDSPPASAVPRAEDVFSTGHELAEPIPASLVDEYVADVVALVPAGAPPRDARIVYTPMHGVGRAITERALAASGFGEVHTVPEQAEPDGRFPTVAFPNPEEPGALDLAVGLADEVGAGLILANDPDADRLAACVPEGGGWRTLTGNQIGQLLGDYLLAADGERGALVVSSIVSSPMLGSIAAGYGARHEQTLTGFKWISNAAMDLERDEGLRFVFGYEEALGYTVGPLVRDKDGIGAAVLFADMVSRLAAAGETVQDRLASLYREHGLWASTQRSIERPGTEGAAAIAAAMGSLRDRRPAALGGLDVVAVTDFRDGAGERPRWLPAQALVEFDLGAAGRVLVRPSGTEPKLKIYVDLRAGLTAGDDVSAVEAATLESAAAVAADLAGFLGL
jgi:phosphomannomutase